MIRCDALWQLAAVVPATAGRAPLEEIDVRAREAGRPKRRDDCNVVGRVVDRSENGK
jgi:hypothetical protein